MLVQSTRFINRLTVLIASSALAGLVLLAGVTGYRLARANLAADLYRERLSDLHQRYDQLAVQYNQAVAKTAVTELLVDGNKLSVIVASADGSRRTIDTPYNPKREIWIGYIVMDGRLWIHKVFDGATPPEQATVINPSLAEIDWQSPGVQTGKAVYSKLTDGRWIITVTGDGSLGLTHAGDAPPATLAAAPTVRDYEQIDQQIQREADNIGPVDVLTSLIGWKAGE